MDLSSKTLIELYKLNYSIEWGNLKEIVPSSSYYIYNYIN